MDPASEDLALSTVLENELMELSADRSLKLSQIDLASFWLLATSEYLSLSKQAIKFIWPFTTTYLCESGLSTVTTSKSKARNKLKPTLDATLCVSLSPISPRLDLIISKKQAQVKSSHLYLYSAFNNTNCNKATAQYQNRKMLSKMYNDKIKHSIFS